MAQTVPRSVTVVGGGLAGSEAAWQLAESGIRVTLFEMRPKKNTAAHVTSDLAELVCSNSLGSDLPEKASGILKAEMRQLNSLILLCADKTRVAAGGALAVDRQLFASSITEMVEQHPNIDLVREELLAVPSGPTIIATGPLTSPSFADSLGKLIGSEYLFFYDALSPIVTHESVNFDRAFVGSRYGRGENADGDYVNCPFTREEYDIFVDALISAERTALRDFEQEDPRFFEGCLPIEVIAQRGRQSLAFGPMRPVGLTDPHTGRRPYAVVQLRQDNVAGSLFNMVGFQTNLKWGEQERVFRLIPGLEAAKFMRFGQMHRNTYVNSPNLLSAAMQLRNHPEVFLAGQITGIEGYVGNAASGLVAAKNMVRYLSGKSTVVFPASTMIGALAHYVAHAEPKRFQPMKANLGILPVPEKSVSKAQRGAWYASQSRESLLRFVEET